jgi:molybdopterin-dependent oxidoreductase-like protein protein
MFLSRKPFYSRILLFALPFFLVPGSGIRAQATADPSHSEMHAGNKEPALPADTLHIEAGQRSIEFTTATFQKLPHTTIKVHNLHTNQDETYSGVALSALLESIGAPLGKELHGKALANYLLAEGADHYEVVLSLAEADPDFHPGEIVVADSMNDKPLDKDGPFKMIVSEDKRPARWVRNLVWIGLESAPSH